MAQVHDSMMNPQDRGPPRARSTPSSRLVTLGSMRARQINSYFGQLGDGLGSNVPPQVTSVARKPLSIAFEEIAADKIVGRAELEAEVAADDGESALTPRRPRRRPMLGRSHASSSASPGASPPTRRSRSAVGWSTPAPHVAPVMTAGATRFVGETTFSALASEPVQTSLWDEADPIPHTRLGQRADVVVVCPATARLIGDYAAGISARPAHRHAARHPGTGDRVPGDAHRDVGAPGRAGQPGHAAPPRRASSSSPAEGRLAGGDVGAGRLADPDVIVAADRGRLAPPAAGDLDGLRVLVTAGGTREPIDPVRVITNRSSGKQGYALAERGRGPRGQGHAGHDRRPAGGRRHRRGRGGDRGRAWRPRSCPRSGDLDVIVMAAAVADFRPGGAGRPQAQEERGSAADRARADPRLPRRPRARPSRPARPWSGSRPRPTTVRGQRPREAGPQGPRPDRRQRRRPPRASASSTTPTRS